MDWVSDTPKALLSLYGKHFIPLPIIDDGLKEALAYIKSKKQMSRLNIGFMDKIIVEQTGSRAEGLSIPDHTFDDELCEDICEEMPFHGFKLADVDEMYIATNIFTYEENNEKYSIFVIEDTDDPRYVKLKLTSEFKNMCSKTLAGEKSLTEAQYIRNTSLTYGAVKSACMISSVEVHGPAACCFDSEGLISSDVVFCYKCDTWPAPEWFIRARRSGWPSERQLTETKRIGCHVVPVGRQSSKMKCYEWRYSFSLTEKMLAHSLTNTQRKAYIYFKMLCVFEIKCSILSTYHLKNILFHSCEKFSMNNLKDTDVYAIILYLLDELINCLVSGHLQHYFLCRCNLLSNVPRLELRFAAKSAVRVRRNLLYYLMAIDQKATFNFLRGKLVDVFFFELHLDTEDVKCVKETFRKKPVWFTKLTLETILHDYLKTCENLTSTTRYVTDYVEKYCKYMVPVKLNSFSWCIVDVVHELHKLERIKLPYLKYLASTIVKYQVSPILAARLFLYLKNTDKRTCQISLNDFFKEISNYILELAEMTETLKTRTDRDKLKIENTWSDMMKSIAGLNPYPDDIVLQTDNLVHFEHKKVQGSRAIVQSTDSWHI